MGPTTVTGAGEATVKGKGGRGSDPWHFLQGPSHYSSTSHRVGHWTKELRSPWYDVINKSSSVFVLFYLVLHFILIARMIMYHKRTTVVN